MNPDKKQIGIGILGLGNIAGTHAEAIQTMQRAGLVAACSRSEPACSKFSEDYHVPAFDSFDSFLGVEGLDVVSICTPSGTHLDYGKKAAEAGKHIIVEKPLEVTVERAEELINCCREHSVHLYVIYQNRYLDAVVQMKKAIDEQLVGDPIRVRAAVKWFRNKEYYTQSGWRGTFKLDGGGAVINQSVHTIDLLLWMLGDIRKIWATTGNLTHPNMEAEDNAAAILEFKNGAMGVFEASTSVVPAQARLIEVNGTKGTAILEGNQFNIVTKNGKLKEQEKENISKQGAENPLSGMKAGLHQKQYREIVEAITENKPSGVTGEEGLRSLKVVEALYKSSKKSCSVTVL